MIDFADCRIGHPEYDLCASVCFIFKNEKEPLREYLLSLGYKNSALNQRLSEKLMAWTCLHAFSNLENYFSKEMKLVPTGDFPALSKLVFPLL